MNVVDLGKFQTANKSLIDIINQIMRKQFVGNKILIIGSGGTGKRTLAEIIHSQTKYNMQQICRFRIGQKIEKCFYLVENLHLLTSAEQEQLQLLMSSNPEAFWVATATPEIEQITQKGLFRAPLLNLFKQKFKMPNLKERNADIEFLVEQNLLTLSWVTGKFCKISKSALVALKGYSWPGNVSELEKVLEAAILKTKNGIIETQHLDIDGFEEHSLTKIKTIAEVERKLILQTLAMTKNNKSQAARLLGISIRTLRNKLSLYNKEVEYESNV